MEILCHYTNNEAAKNILKNMKLRFGKVIKSNDPVEIKQLMIYQGYEENDNPDMIEIIEYDLKDYLYNILNLISFSEGKINIEELSSISFSNFEYSLRACSHYKKETM